MLIRRVVEDLAHSADFDRTVVRSFCFGATKALHRRMGEIGELDGTLEVVKMLADPVA